MECRIFTTAATSGAVIVYLSGEPAFTLVLNEFVLFDL